MSVRSFFDDFIVEIGVDSATTFVFCGVVDAAPGGEIKMEKVVSYLT